MTLGTNTRDPAERRVTFGRDNRFQVELRLMPHYRRVEPRHVRPRARHRLRRELHLLPPRPDARGRPAQTGGRGLPPVPLDAGVEAREFRALALLPLRPSPPPSNCSACHTQAGTFKTYSCYGCHEHSPAKIAAEHSEEGITNFDDCVRCHRSGDEGEGGRGGDGHGGRGGREEDEH